MVDTWRRLPNLIQVFTDFLQPKYTAYYAALPAGPVKDAMPVPTDIEYSAYSGGAPHTIEIWEEFMDPDAHSIGGALKSSGQVSIKLITRWTTFGTPPWYEEFRHFVNQTINKAKRPDTTDWNTYFRPYKIHQIGILRHQLLKGRDNVRSVNSKILEDTGTAMEDFWTYLCIVGVVIHEQDI